ncbi:MAG: hypothetical protein AAF494_01225 [Pseudomonadota bacterium]
MLHERRRSPFPADLLIRVGIAWVLVTLMLVAVHAMNVPTYRSMGPDDMLRLVQVRDLVEGQGWFDLRQTRLDATNGGVPMHWSRLVDIPLVLMILALTPILGAGAAEVAAVMIVPLVTLGIALLLTARIASRLLGDEEVTLTCLIFALSIPVLFQLGPMRIDHHGWQIVCVLAAMNGLMARSPRLGGLIIGAAMANWLAISIEGLPMAVAFFAVLAFRWLRDRGDRVYLQSAIQSLAVMSAVFFVATRGFSDLASHCDAISPIHLALFGWGALVLTILARLEPIPRGLVLAGFAVAGGGALGMMLFSAPQCVTGGGFAELDPLVAEFWHANVDEGMPIWQQELKIALQFGVTPAFGLFAAINLAARSRDWLRRFWSDYAILLAAAFVTSLLVARAGAVACVLAAPPLAWQVRSWLRAIRLMDQPWRRASAMLGVACALLPVLPLTFLTSAQKAQAAFGGPAVAPEPKRVSDCRIAETALLLKDLPPGEMYAPLDLAPRLLLATPHRLIASGHHRGSDAMRLVIEIAVGSPDDARQILSDRGTRYVAVCTDLGEPALYQQSAPDGFMARLIADEPQLDWLEPLPVAPGSTLRAWRIKPE